MTRREALKVKGGEGNCDGVPAKMLVWAVDSAAKFCRRMPGGLAEARVDEGMVLCARVIAPRHPP